MKRYGRLSGDSGVTAYHIEDEAIRVRFVDGTVYRYSYASSGPHHVENMKLLASAGSGLSSYISRYVRDSYESSR
jgi:hypothetical protein